MIYPIQERKTDKKIWPIGSQGLGKGDQPLCAAVNRGQKIIVSMAPREEGPYFTYNLKMEVTSSPQISVTMYKTTWSQNPVRIVTVKTSKIDANHGTYRDCTWFWVPQHHNISIASHHSNRI